MVSSLSRRGFLVGAGLAALPFAPAIAQSEPVRIGLLTVKTGPLAQGGIQMEQGLTLFLKDRNNALAGRKVEMISADTGGNPAGAKTKAQELVERDKVDFIVGPLAAFELLAITDYIADARMPMLSLAAADDMTQRKPNPWFIRASATSSQCNHPLGDYAAKEMKLKAAATITEDFAFGYEQAGGFQRAFEDNGGTVVKKLWPPLVTADYTPYLAQIKDVDCVWTGFAGSNPIKLMKQYDDIGLHGKYPVLGGWTAFDDALLKSFGDEAVGAISASWYSTELDTPSNKTFVAGMQRDYQNPAGRLRRRHLHQRHGDRGGAREDRRQDGAAGSDRRLARRLAHRYAARSLPFRSPRQRHRQRLHPPARGQGRQARQHHRQDLRRCRVNSGPTARSKYLAAPVLYARLPRP